MTEPEYLDVFVPSGSTWEHPTTPGHTVIAYIISGEGHFGGEGDQPAGNEDLILFGDGEQVAVTTTEQPVRFLLLSGRPIGEPVAWMGPIVMNTQEELRRAFEEYDKGTFIKHRAA